MLAIQFPASDGLFHRSATEREATTTAYNRPEENRELKILRLKTAVVEGNFDWTFVRIETDEGLEAWASVFSLPASLRFCVRSSRCWWRRPPRHSSLVSQIAARHLRAGSVAGIVYNAISGIEAALWDVLGQGLDVPIYRLLGGKFRDRVRIYADCHGGEALESSGRGVAFPPSIVGIERRARTRQRLLRRVHRGPSRFARRLSPAGSQEEGGRIHRLKFDLDVPGTEGPDPHNRALSNRAIDHMVSLIGAVHDAVGKDTDIAVDCHWRYNASDVVKVARTRTIPAVVAGRSGPAQQHCGAEGSGSRVRVPIATGENLFLFEGFQEIIAQHALSMVTPDLQKVGGLSVAQSIAQFADVHTMPVAPHNISSPVGTLAAAHFCAAIPNFLALEFHASDVPFWNDLVEGLPKPIIQNGFISLPEKPGLGVELNEEVARRYARKGEPFFE
jgi:L-alanine-DL-glutamate epimerase-like enolase superfamily enzyme